MAPTVCKIRREYNILQVIPPYIFNYSMQIPHVIPLMFNKAEASSLWRIEIMMVWLRNTPRDAYQTVSKSPLRSSGPTVCSFIYRNVLNFYINRLKRQ